MTTDYKNTLNLPQTDFPMKANLAQREPAMLKHWQAINLYAARQNVSKGRNKFILHDGPPYANGNIHIGHAVNKTLKDMVLRSKFLAGFDVPYIPGWDCHGLPIEINVEKKIGKVGAKVSAKEFRQACREYADDQVNKQREDFKRLGILADWERPYLTKDPVMEASTIRGLAKIIENGHLQQGVKPVYWCFDCGSSLAEAEVEYQDKTSPSIDVKFTAVDQETLLKKFHFSNSDHGQGEVSIVIWTTTPWTLPANRGVALHPELIYALVQFRDERIILAKDLVTQVMARYGESDYKILATSKGSELEHTLLQHPFYDRQVPILLGDHVTIDAGTGAVHTAPSHGEDDYRIGKKYALPIDFCVQANGVYADNVELFAGEYVWKANAHVIEILKEKNTLMHQTTVNHSYPHCWRHKAPLIFRATPQWFVSMDKQNLRNNSLQAIKNVKWLPTWGEQRMEKMLDGRPDWCISRQRAWGVPIPIFVHKQTQELHPDTQAIMEKVAQQVETKGIDAWFDSAPEDFNVSSAEYDKLNDVLDVWFDSGLMHFNLVASGQWPELQSPADVYLEGSDQYRGWFQSSLLTGVAIDNFSPYRANITHGFTVDAQGRKMSKSIGNVIAPEKVVNSLGADILRLWVASSDYTAEMTVSDEILNRSADVYRRIRNTARFLLSNLAGFDPAKDLVSADKMIQLDRWVIMQTAAYQDLIKASYNDYQFHIVAQKLQHFCSIELGSFYLDIIKDRQYTCKTDSIARRSTQTAMYHILQALVRWMAPIMPFTADEIWQHMPGEKSASVHVEQWYNLSNKIISSSITPPEWRDIIEVRNAVNKQLEIQRQAGIIGAPLEAEVILFADNKLKAVLNKLDNELRFILITSRAVVKSLAEKTSAAIATDLPGLSVEVFASAHEKCARCWHRQESVNKDPEYPGICGRCVENVAGAGEVRKFA